MKETTTHTTVLPQFRFDEPEQVFLVHAARVVNVSIHFAHVVKVSVRYALEPKKEHERSVLSTKM